MQGLIQILTDQSSISVTTELATYVNLMNTERQKTFEYNIIHF